MTCNCIDRVEKNVKELAEASIGNVVDSVKLANTGFIFGASSLTSALYIPVRVKADATGYRSKNGKEVSLVANYCPFCGEKTKYAKDKESEGIKKEGSNDKAQKKSA